jgi:hypothetical protein
MGKGLPDAAWPLMLALPYAPARQCKDLSLQLTSPLLPRPLLRYFYCQPYHLRCLAISSPSSPDRASVSGVLVPILAPPWALILVTVWLPDGRLPAVPGRRAVAQYAKDLARLRKGRQDTCLQSLAAWDDVPSDSCVLARHLSSVAHIHVKTGCCSHHQLYYRRCAQPV